MEKLNSQQLNTTTNIEDLIDHYRIEFKIISDRLDQYLKQGEAIEDDSGKKYLLDSRLNLYRYLSTKIDALSEAISEIPEY